MTGIYEDAVHFDHSHLLDDMRGPLLPTDARSHISRINDWIGSDTWVQGCRADRPGPEDPMSEDRYPEPKLPYQLLKPAFHEGRMMRPSEVVYIEPSKRGSQHAMIPGQKYPDLPPPAAVNDPLKISDNEISQLVLEVRELKEMLMAHLVVSKPASATAKADDKAKD